MSHFSQMHFVGLLKKYMPNFFEGARTLEVGSLNINGSVREFFVGGEYIGIDVAPGPDVDIVAQGQSFDGPTDGFDTIISCEVMEHNPHWRETMTNMARMLRPGGLMIMTCATIGRAEHGTTRSEPTSSPLTVGIGWDYYKNLSKKDFARALPLKSWFGRYHFFSDFNSSDLYLVAFKRGGGVPAGYDEAVQAVAAHCRRANIRHLINIDYIKMRIAVCLFGEERYLAGPIKFW